MILHLLLCRSVADPDPARLGPYLPDLDLEYLSRIRLPANSLVKSFIFCEEKLIDYQYLNERSDPGTDWIFNTAL